MISKYIIQTAALVLLMAAAKCEPPSEQASLDDLIKEIFTMEPVNGNPSSPPPTPLPDNPPRGPDTYAPPTTPAYNHIPGPPEEHLQPSHPMNPEPIEENVGHTIEVVPRELH